MVSIEEAHMVCHRTILVYHHQQKQFSYPKLVFACCATMGIDLPWRRPFGTKDIIKANQSVVRVVNIGFQ